MDLSQIHQSHSTWTLVRVLLFLSCDGSGVCLTSTSVPALQSFVCPSQGLKPNTFPYYPLPPQPSVTAWCLTIFHPKPTNLLLWPCCRFPEPYAKDCFVFLPLCASLWMEPLWSSQHPPCPREALVSMPRAFLQNYMRSEQFKVSWDCARSLNNHLTSTFYMLALPQAYQKTEVLRIKFRPVADVQPHINTSTVMGRQCLRKCCCVTSVN